MMKFVSKALLSMVMDKSAREKLEAHREAKEKMKGDAPAADPAKADAGKSAAPGASAQLAAQRSDRPREMTDERRRIIKEALEIQNKKSEIFDQLDDGAKAKLLITAVKAMGLTPAEVERTLRPKKAGAKGPDRA